jgi:small subunit ribosomal protein S19
MGRAAWKGPYLDPKYFKELNLIEKQNVNFMSRNSEIIPPFIGLTFKVHNGKNYVEVSVTEDMVGHKFGEFVFTRARFIFKKKKSKK